MVLPFQPLKWGEEWHEVEALGKGTDKLQMDKLGSLDDHGTEINKNYQVHQTDYNIQIFLNFPTQIKYRETILCTYM